MSAPPPRTVPGITHRLRVRPDLPAAVEEGAPLARVSVVIPCYNYAHFLPAAVKSALEQDGADVDVIVVDDASADASAGVAAALAKTDARIRLLRHPVNRGPVETFNDGLALARGEFVVRLDADDMLTPTSLARAIAVARRYPSVGLIYGHPLHCGQQPLPKPRERVTGWTIWPGTAWLADRCRTGLNVITSPEVVMRGDVVAEVGGQMPLAHTHDLEMWLRIATVSDVAYIHGADQAWHRDHADSLSARKVDVYRDLVERHLAFQTLFDGPFGRPPSVASLRSVAEHAIAANALAHAIDYLNKGGDRAAQADTFIEFAANVVPDVSAVPGWSAVQRRKRMRPRRRHWYPPFVFDRLKRRVESELSRNRWHRSGVF